MAGVTPELMFEVLESMPARLAQLYAMPVRHETRFAERRLERSDAPHLT